MNADTSVVRAEAVARVTKALGERWPRWPFALWVRRQEVASVAVDESHLLEILDLLQEEAVYWQQRGGVAEALVADLVKALKWQTHPGKRAKGAHRSLFERAEALSDYPGTPE